MDSEARRLFADNLTATRGSRRYERYFLQCQRGNLWITGVMARTRTTLLTILGLYPHRRV